MHSHRRFMLELAPEISLRQIVAFAHLVRHVELRRRQVEALREQMALVFGPGQLDQNVSCGRRTLLVADDQPVVGAITRELLEALGHGVILTSGDFRGVPRKASIDAVLLDVPIFTERQLERLRQARGIAPHVIVSTPLPEGSARAWLRAAGATAFVGKPFHPAALARAIQEVVGR